MNHRGFIKAICESPDDQSLHAIKTIMRDDQVVVKATREVRIGDHCEDTTGRIIGVALESGQKDDLIRVLIVPPIDFP